MDTKTEIENLKKMPIKERAKQQTKITYGSVCLYILILLGICFFVYSYFTFSNSLLYIIITSWTSPILYLLLSLIISTIIERLFDKRRKEYNEIIENAKKEFETIKKEKLKEKQR